MTQLNIPKKIDTNKELTAIVDYLTQTWEGVDGTDLHAFVSSVWIHGLEKSKLFFDPYMTNDVLGLWSDEASSYEHWKTHGTDMTEQEFNAKAHKSSIYNLPSRLVLNTSKLSQLIQENFNADGILEEIHQSVIENFSSMSSLLPKNWETTTTEDVSLESVDIKAIKKSFKGHDFNKNGSSFAVNLRAEAVKYYDEEQETSPLNYLLGEILTHALNVNKYNNGVDMVNDIVNTRNGLEQEYYQKQGLNLPIHFSQPHNEALIMFAQKKTNKKYSAFLKGENKPVKKL